MQRSSSILVATLLTMSACTGNVGDENIAILSPIFGDAGDAAFGLPDSGVPVFVPPPLGDAGAAIGTMPNGGFDAGVVVPFGDAGKPVADAGSLPPANAAENPCSPGPEPVAAALRVREVSIYQTVKIPLYKDTAWVTTRNASVVQGKTSLVRAFVEPMTGFAAHALRGVLTLDNDGTKTVLTADRTITRASTDEASDSTFDFPVDGKLIGPSTQLSVSVQETTCASVAAANSGARIPATGAQAINATAIAKLRAVMVPVAIGGRTPDTSEAQLAKIRDALKAYYPVAEVEVTARAPISWTNPVAADGTGWSELLNQIGRTRQTDMVGSSVYYFGLITPTAAFRDYCRTGCVLGLAPQTTFVSRTNQIGLGVGFVDENTYTTIVHELGHAHGLPHAPCAPRGGAIDGADTRFPYADAKIGSWGWDSRSNKLMSPTTYADVMSYCDPVWISDYNYEKIATRSKAVNSAAFIYTSPTAMPVTWHGVLLSGSGATRWLGMTLDESPGQVSQARALDATGKVVAQVSVVRIPLSHNSDSFLYIPDPDPSWAALDLGDRTVMMDEIAAALQ